MYNFQKNAYFNILGIAYHTIIWYNTIVLFKKGSELVLNFQVLYLQKDYSSNTFCISYAITNKSDLCPYDYDVIVEHIKGDSRIIDIYEFVVKTYNCKKLVYQL